MTMGKIGTDTEFNWDLVADPCVSGYRILHADWGGPDFTSVVDDTGLTNTYAFDAPEGLFLVAGNGPGGTGPSGRN
jgi:hypothetical protein